MTPRGCARWSWDRYGKSWLAGSVVHGERSLQLQHSDLTRSRMSMPRCNTGRGASRPVVSSASSSMRGQLKRGEGQRAPPAAAPGSAAAPPLERQCSDDCSMCVRGTLPPGLRATQGLPYLALRGQTGCPPPATWGASRRVHLVCMMVEAHTGSSERLPAGNAPRGFVVHALTTGSGLGATSLPQPSRTPHRVRPCPLVSPDQCRRWHTLQLSHRDTHAHGIPPQPRSSREERRLATSSFQ